MPHDDREGRAHEASREYWSRISDNEPEKSALIAGLAVKNGVTEDEVRNAVRRWRLHPPLGSARPQESLGLGEDGDHTGRVTAWHTEEEDFYHVCSACVAAEGVHPEKVRAGTGRKLLCEECQRLISSGHC